MVGTQQVTRDQTSDLEGRDRDLLDFGSRIANTRRREVQERKAKFTKETPWILQDSLARQQVCPSSLKDDKTSPRLDFLMNKEN